MITNMNDDLNETIPYTPLCFYIERSGSLPISFNGHYSHWIKYNGKRPFLMKQERINQHLKDARMKRSLTVLKTKLKNANKLPPVKREEKKLKRKTTLKPDKDDDDENEIVSETDEWDKDSVLNSGKWWPFSPLPEIKTAIAAATAAAATTTTTITTATVNDTTTNDTTDNNTNVIIKQNLGNTNDPIKQPFTIIKDVQVWDNKEYFQKRKIDLNQLANLQCKNQIVLYVCSPNKDTYVERVHMWRYVWPDIRSLSLEKGFEFLIYDLHTNYEGQLSNGNGFYRRNIDKYIALTKENRFNTLKSLILIGNQMDQNVLPEQISDSDMAAICTSIESSSQTIADLKNELSQLKEKQKSAAKHRQAFKLTRGYTQNSIISNSTLSPRREPSFDPPADDELDNIRSKVEATKEELHQLIYDTNSSLLKKWYGKPNDNDNEDVTKNCNYYLKPERSVINNLLSTNFQVKLSGLENVKLEKDQIYSILSKHKPELCTSLNTDFSYEIETLKPLFAEGNCMIVTRSFSEHNETDSISSMKKDILRKIPDNKQLRFELVEYLEDGVVSPEAVGEHRSYLRQMKIDTVRILKNSIEAGICQWRENQDDFLSTVNVTNMNEEDIRELFTELSVQHHRLINLTRKSKEEPELEELNLITKEINQLAVCFVQMKDNLTLSDHHNCIVLTGESMAGKTRIMTNVVQSCIKIINNVSETLIIYRFLGTSYQSDRCRKLFLSICAQLIYVTGLEYPLPKKLSQLKMLFHNLISLIQFPVLLILDGIDYLSDFSKENMDLLDWLPNKANIEIIISVSSSSPKYAPFKNLLESINIQFTSITIPQLNTESIGTLFHFFTTALVGESSILTENQTADLKQHINDGQKTIGYINSCFRITQFWTEHSSLPRLGAKLEQNILYYFAKLEDIYGDVLMRRLIGYLVAFANGPTLTELMDLLTLDDAFMKNVQKLCYPTMQQCTFGFIDYLLNYLYTFITDYYNEDGFTTLKLDNAAICKCASDRYLEQKDKAASYHSVAAIYYMNDRADIELYNNVVQDNDTQYPVCPTSVVPQKLLFNDFLQNCGGQRRFNKRKIIQLPYQLTGCANTVLLKAVCILNFYWLQAALLTIGIVDLIEIVERLKMLENEDNEYPLLQQALQMSGPVLQSDPLQLNSQLYGRLKQIVKDDNSSKETVKLYSNFNRLLKQLKSNRWFKMFQLLKPYLPSPLSVDNSIQIDVIGKVTCMELNENNSKLIICTQNGVLYILNTSNFNVTNLIFGVKKDVSQIFIISNRKSVILANNNNLEIWNTETGSMAMKIEMSFDPYNLTLSEDRTLLSAIFFGTSLLSTWDLGTLSLTHSGYIDINPNMNNKGEIITSKQCKGNKALMAIKLDNKAFLVNITDGKIDDNRLKCKVEGSSITAVSVSTAYYVLCCRAQALNTIKTNIFFIETFGIDNCQNMRRIVGCSLDNVIDIAINSIGSHAITTNVDVKNNTSDISLWNLETEEHRHCLTTSGLNSLSVIREFSIIYLCEPAGNCISKVNVQSSLQSTKVINKIRQNYTIQHYPNNDRYLLLTSDDNATLNFYDMARNKLRGSLVDGHSQLVEPNDVVLMYKNKLIILTDKWYSPIAEECKDVFQSIKIYNLELGRITVNINNLVIYPSRKEEFIILDDDNIMGLSDNRSHLIIWSYNDGNIQYRIRPLLTNFDPSHFPDMPNRNNSTLDRFIHELAVDIILISGDRSTAVASYSTKFLCVFSLVERKHVCNISGEPSVLYLHTTSLSYDGNYLIQNNYNEITSSLNLTIWNCRTGLPVSNITVHNPILAVSIDTNSEFAFYVEENVGLFCWQFQSPEAAVPVLIPVSWKLKDNNQFGIQMLHIDHSNRLIICTGYRIHLIERTHNNDTAAPFQLVASFEPHQCVHSISVFLDDSLIAFTVKGSSELYTICIKAKDEYNIGNSLAHFEKEPFSDTVGQT